MVGRRGGEKEQGEKKRRENQIRNEERSSKGQRRDEDDYTVLYRKRERERKVLEEEACQSISDNECGKVQLTCIKEVILDEEKEGNMEGRWKIIANQNNQIKVTQKQDILQLKKTSNGCCFYLKLQQLRYVSPSPFSLLPLTQLLDRMI